MILENLKNKIAHKNATLGIVGLGYVGLPLAIAACFQGVRTIGFDVDNSKIEALKLKKSYITGITGEQLERLHETNLFTATDDKNALKQADFILLCVPTPLTKNHTPDMSYVEKSCEMVASILRIGQVVILESTTYPGTSQELMIPILEKSGLVHGQDFFIAYSPEREDPGNAHFSTHTIPKVVGADDATVLEITCDFYRQFIKKIVPVSSTRTAEAVKLVENIFRSVNIGLVNELKMVFDGMGIDIYDVIDAAATKPFGYMPFYPGPGIGGHCIPIDPLYLTWKSHEYKNSTRFIKVATEVNQQMPNYVVKQFTEQLNDILGIALKKAKILIVGLTYKKNVKDLRESPAADIVHLLQKRGADLCYYDPFVESVDNTEFSAMKPFEWDLQDLKQFDAALILTDHDGIDWQGLQENCFTFDTRGILRKINRANNLQ